MPHYQMKSCIKCRARTACGRNKYYEDPQALQEKVDANMYKVKTMVAIHDAIPLLSGGTGSCELTVEDYNQGKCRNHFSEIWVPS